MFREMRRIDNLLSTKEAWSIVENNTYGVLSLIGDNGYPYGVPMHYVIIDNTIYMHGTNDQGHKLSAIRNESKMSLTILDMENKVKGNSVIIFGTINIDNKMTSAVLEKFIETHVPELAWEQAKEGINFAVNKVESYSLNIEHLSGKKIDIPK